MGLGKTVQTIALLNHLHLHENVHGPFLVIAPLSTLGHWKREFDEWTDMHCVYYHDPHQGEASRALIRKHEWLYPGRVGQRLASKSGVYKFNVVLTSYHVLLMDWEFFKSIRFRYVVVDEAHALKNRESQLQLALREMSADSLLLLTGTPLQNDTFELWALLKLVAPEKFGTREEFHDAYGDLRTGEQVQALQKELQPLMLRRVKEDVEKSIPPKEETIINVELTQLQKQYYRAIFERNRAFLTRGAANMPPSSLISIEMELRKVRHGPSRARLAARLCPRLASYSAAPPCPCSTVLQPPLPAAQHGAARDGALQDARRPRRRARQQQRQDGAPRQAAAQAQGRGPPPAHLLAVQDHARPARGPAQVAQLQVRAH